MHPDRMTEEDALCARELAGRGEKEWTRGGSEGMRYWTGETRFHGVALEARTDIIEYVVSGPAMSHQRDEWYAAGSRR